MKVKIILNPFANRWGARKRVPQVTEAARAAGLNFDLVLTETPGQATQEALAAAQGGAYDAIVSAGGDGTLNEVVNGLVRAAGSGPTVPLGILPVGTGNDFNDMAGLPRNLLAAAHVIAGGKTRPVDAGRVNNHYFSNNCAVAMEPMVTIENIKMTRLSGNIRYVVALVRALVRLSAWNMRIEWEGGGYEGPTYLLSVCNSPRTGGLFMMSPAALMDDGLFDFVHAPKISKLEVLQILPRLFKGTHIQHPKVTHGRSPFLNIESEPGTPIHADGEVIAVSEKRVAYEVLPKKLTLLVP